MWIIFSQNIVIDTPNIYTKFTQITIVYSILLYKLLIDKTIKLVFMTLYIGCKPELNKEGTLKKKD